MDILIKSFFPISLIVFIIGVFRKHYLHFQLLKQIYQKELKNLHYLNYAGGKLKDIPFDAIWAFVPFYWNDGTVDLTNSDIKIIHKKLKQNNYLIACPVLVALTIFFGNELLNDPLSN